MGSFLRSGTLCLLAALLLSGTQLLAQDAAVAKELIRLEEVWGAAIMKKDPETRTIPFVFLTGNADAMAGKLGRQLGAEEYIEKPFSFSKLLAAVGTSLRK